MPTSSLTILIAMVATLVGGCGETRVQTRDTTDARMRVPAMLEREAERTLMKTASQITMRRGGANYFASVPFTYTNSRSDTIFLVNCNGDVSPAIQQLTDTGWANWWIPSMAACMSPPMPIMPGSVYYDTLDIGIGPHAGSYFQQLVEGTGTPQFRLVWHQAMKSFDERFHPRDDPWPVEDRVSNSFTIVVR